MKLIAQILNKLNIPVESMAYPRSKAVSLVEFLARSINEHLINCYLGNNTHKCWNHWLKELTAWFNKISSIKCKPNNKSLDKNTLRRIFITEDLDDEVNLKHIEEYMSIKEDLNLRNEEPKVLWKRFEDFYNELCLLLEQGLIIQTKQLEKLILKYFK